MKNTHICILVLIIWTLHFSGCREKFTPRPHGYFRISFPEKSYRLVDSIFPYKFDIPVYSRIVKDPQLLQEPYWINIQIPTNKAEVHISYYQIENHEISGNKNKNSPETQKRMMLAKLIEDSRELAYKHTIKADAIDEQIFLNPGEKVFGTIYNIKGNAASPIQFYLTDSTDHFLRGALYIREVPNIDSIRPVIEFLEPDIIKLIESTSWKK